MKKEVGRDLGRAKTQKLKRVENSKLAMKANVQKLNPSKFVAQVTSPEISSSVIEMSSPGTGAKAKGSAAGTNEPDEPNALVVAN